MKNWFLSLAERDRKIVVGLAVSVAFLMIYTFVWMPLLKENQQFEQGISRSQTDLEWMQQAAKKIMAAGPAVKTPTETNTSAGSFLTLIETTAANADIKLEKIVPKKDRQVELRLQNVSFNKTISWVELLKRKHGVLVTKFSAEKMLEGKVNLVVVFEG